MEMKYILTTADGLEYNLISTQEILLIGLKTHITPRISKHAKYWYVIQYDMKKLDFIRKMFSHSKFDKNSSVSLEAARKYYDTLLPYDKDNIDKYVVKIPISIVYDNLKKFRKYLRYYIQPVHYKTQSTPVDPYIIGVCLAWGWQQTYKQNHKY